MSSNFLSSSNAFLIRSRFEARQQQEVLAVREEVQVLRQETLQDFGLVLVTIRLKSNSLVPYNSLYYKFRRLLCSSNNVTNCKLTCNFQSFHLRVISPLDLFEPTCK